MADLFLHYFGLSGCGVGNGNTVVLIKANTSSASVRVGVLTANSSRRFSMSLHRRNFPDLHQMCYSQLPITQNFRGNSKRFELSEVRVIEGKII